MFIPWHWKYLWLVSTNPSVLILTNLLAGAHIGSYALTFTTKKTRLVALTPHLSTAIESGNRYARQTLLKAFEVACTLRSHIMKDRERVYDTPLEEIDVDPQERSHLGDFPYVYQDTAIPGPGMFKFEINREVFQGEGGNRYPNRFIYMTTAAES
ncbi:hypothetical protein B0F90DRAFT_1821420 [Multifurca ochricompacta]|uniref:Uncharacterized protein n=1 Tax=Multifurca ochricompacta TaxID=376703 RepID=A0AAD4LXN2_9AGAM|nr:hypothetical protein B0F90DRAFT_1821420 [Multifurca ochricompacta]